MQQLVETFIINLPTEWFAQQTEFKTEFESMEIHEMNNCLRSFIYRHESRTEATTRKQVCCPSGQR